MKLYFALLSLFIIGNAVIGVNGDDDDDILTINEDSIDGFVEINDVASSAGGGEHVFEKTKCTDDDDVKRSWDDIDANVARLEKEGKIKNRISPILSPKFGFPLKNLFPSKYAYAWGISNYVDHDPMAGSLKDYYCGKRTYDITGYNHKGIDVYLWPFPWLMKSEGAVGIVAGAAGVIVAKYDGNSDNNCAMGSGNWNAVYIKHADGSVAWYGHMKKGSLTTKSVGASVAKGELIGRVGSSGSSTGPHLHFEVYDSNKKLIDPFAGTCNTWNTASWWSAQQAYWNPKIHYINIMSSPMSYPNCPIVESPTIVTTVKRGTLYYFHRFFSANTSGSTATCQILKPSGVAWVSFSQTFNQNYSFSYWYNSYTIGTNEPTGIWTYKCNYNGVTLVRGFKVI